MRKLLQMATTLLLATTTVEAQTVSGALTTSSPMTAALDGGPLVYYYHAYTFDIVTPGEYIFSAASDFDSYALIYDTGNLFYYENPGTLAIAGNDDDPDGVGGVDFKVTHTFLPGTYTITVSTFSEFETGTYSMTVTGPASLTITDAISVPGAPPPPLPLDLLTFTARAQGNSTATLEWKTANEKKVSHFDVERSADGHIFSKIGEVQANNAASDYIDYDRMPVQGINYYRLRMVDEDGSFTYSKTVTAAVGMGNGAYVVHTSPNPVSNMLKVEAFGATANATVELTDIAGKVISRHTMQAGNVLNLDMSDLSGGVYLLRYTDGVNTELVRLNKQ